MTAQERAMPAVGEPATEPIPWSARTYVAPALAEPPAGRRR